MQYTFFLNKHSAVIKYLLADMGRRVSGISNNAFHLGKGFCYLVLYRIKSCAVMDISGSYHRFQHKAITVTGRMSLIRKLPLVAALYE